MCVEVGQAQPEVKMPLFASRLRTLPAVWLWARCLIHGTCCCTSYTGVHLLLKYTAACKGTQELEEEYYYSQWFEGEMIDQNNSS